MERILLFGGSFDPVHKGHEEIVRASSELFHPDRFLIIPTHISPLKQGGTHASPEDRLAMLLRLFPTGSDIIIDPVELQRGGSSYTVDTVMSIRKKYGENTEILFLIGSDNLLVFKEWNSWETLLELCKFIVIPRIGYAVSNAEADIRRKMFILNSINIPCSSSEIRQRIKDPDYLQRFLAEDTLNYIREKGLYGIND